MIFQSQLQFSRDTLVDAKQALGHILSFFNQGNYSLVETFRALLFHDLSGFCCVESLMGAVVVICVRDISYNK